MIARYTLPEMGAVWSQENKFQKWLTVEILICEAWARLGRIPGEAVSEIREKASFKTERIQEIEETTRHDLAAFVQNVSENIGEAGKYLHFGVTSYDVEDTALSLLLRDSADLLTKDLEELSSLLLSQAVLHKKTLMAGRTHGMHAEPVTWGLKLLLWHSEMERQKERLSAARDSVSVGKISGAVGTYATVPPFVESFVCGNLDLKPAPVSSQILQRDRQAHYLTTLALIAGTVEKISLEIRHLQRTEVGEVEESFAKGQKGSSAMPHKKNPIVSEQLCGLSRVIRGNAVAGLENMALWHERDITHSSVERIVLPDSSILTDYLLRKIRWLLENLKVNEGRMLENLRSGGGLFFSQHLMLALINKGLSREEAYRLAQEASAEAVKNNQNLREAASTSGRISGLLDEEELSAVFDESLFIAHVDEIFSRFGR
jgi:adenylosuccinate lyase